MQANEEEGIGEDFIRRQGPAYLAHLLRRLSDELVRGADAWYPEVGVTVPPRTTSTLLALDEHGPLGVTEISTLLRQSHPLVINWISSRLKGWPGPASTSRIEDVRSSHLPPRVLAKSGTSARHWSGWAKPRRH